MGLYNKPVLDLLYALINRDNPGLTIPLSPENTVLLGGPYTNNLGTSGRDTRAVFNAVAGKGYTGNLEVFYDRINLGYLFNNLSPKVTVPYLATTRAQMLPYINEALGLQLTVADIAMPTTAAALSTTATGNITITVVTTCLAFSGEFTFTFVRELPRLVDVYLPDNDRYMSQWLNFAFAGKIHARNFEAWRSTLNAVQRGVPLVTSTPGAAAFLTMLINTTGIPFTLGTTLPANPAAYDITGGLRIIRYAANTPRNYAYNQLSGSCYGGGFDGGCMYAGMLMHGFPNEKVAFAHLAFGGSVLVELDIVGTTLMKSDAITRNNITALSTNWIRAYVTRMVYYDPFEDKIMECNPKLKTVPVEWIPPS